MATNAGYSGTPLANKLGIKSGFNILLINEPDYYLSLFEDLPALININNDLAILQDLVHIFVKDKETYIMLLPQLKQQIKPNGIIWVSWPKKASKVSTDITEDIVRDYALQIGLVDIKVCAVDAIWSGLKLVIPVRARI